MKVSEISDKEQTMTGKWKQLHTQKDGDKKIYIGMWEGDDEIYFGVDGLAPDDVIGQDYEFPIKIEALKQLIKHAELS